MAVCVTERGKDHRHGTFDIEHNGASFQPEHGVAKAAHAQLLAQAFDQLDRYWHRPFTQIGLAGGSHGGISGAHSGVQVCTAKLGRF